MLNPEITLEAVNDFKASAVWEEIEMRLAEKQEVLFAKLVDPDSATEMRDKLEYRIYSEVRDLPDLFLEEIKQDKEEKEDERKTQQGRTGASRRF